MSAQNFLLKKYLRHIYKPRLNASLSLEEARDEQEKLLEKYMPDPPGNIRMEQRFHADSRCLFYKHKYRDTGCLVFYIHGGMFVMGSPETHQGICAALAQEGGFHVLAPAYKLAPEHTFPAAIEQLEKTYHAIRKDLPENYPIVLAGDQAGANLALLLALRLRDNAHLPRPLALVLLSPFMDLSLSGDSITSLSEADCSYTEHVFTRSVQYYLPRHLAADDATVSPLFADLSGLPATPIQVSDSEMLLDDSRRLARRLQQQGVAVELDIWKEVPSCWQAAAQALPEGRKAVRAIARHIKKMLAPATAL